MTKLEELKAAWDAAEAAYDAAAHGAAKAAWELAEADVIAARKLSYAASAAASVAHDAYMAELKKTKETL